MDNQAWFNVGIGLISAMLGWWLNNVWTALKELQNVDRELAEKVASIEVLVAGKYVTRDEFSLTLGQIFAKLDKIIDSLNHKVDR
jgi:hypothetical protein